MVEPEKLAKAFEDVRRRRIDLFNAGESELKARDALKAKETEILCSVPAKDLGANEEARRARIRALTSGERISLEQAEAAKRRAQLDYELACNLLDCMKWHIINDAVEGKMGVV